ncbi:MAG: methyl-accepting chemotaxis protein [Proteobacteria bacterium]|nr:methyl-accepting chemotaxis protein [Pseudomonadota bacterium]
MQTQYKRRTYYIKNSAQSKFIFRFVMLSILGGTLALGAFNYLAFKKINSVLYSMRLPKISPGGLLWDEMIYTNAFVILFILIAFALTARGLFNKIHGPLKKLTSDILRITEGELQFPITLRQNDEFRDIADELSAMKTSLNQRMTKIQELADTIVRLSKTPQSDNTSETLANLKVAVSDLRKATGAFVL